MSETPAIPVEMIEAAARALAECMSYEGYLFTGRYPGHEEVRDVWRDRASLVLAAALRVGETRTEWDGDQWEIRPVDMRTEEAKLLDEAAELLKDGPKAGQSIGVVARRHAEAQWLILRAQLAATRRQVSG